MDAPSSSSSAQSSLASSAQTSPITANKFIPPPPRRDNSQASTDMFLKDFTLVAEAAKRAQMAVLMRDLENVGLS